MNVLWQFLLLLLRALLPALTEQARDRSEDSAAPGELEKRLREKIRKDGWHPSGVDIPAQTSGKDH